MKRTELKRRKGLEAKRELRRRAPLRAAAPQPPPSAAQLRRELTAECCGKRRFATRKVAEAEVIRLGVADWEKLPASTYQCPEGWWHLTAQPRAEQIARAAVRARKRTSGIRPVSKKRAAENRQRRAMADELHPERPLCIVWELASNTAVDIPAAALAVCGRWADDLHEPLTRARGGPITDEANTVPMCRAHNHMLAQEPESTLAWAYELGLLVHSGRPTKAVPRRAA